MGIERARLLRWRQMLARGRLEVAAVAQSQRAVNEVIASKTVSGADVRRPDEYVSVMCPEHR